MDTPDRGKRSASVVEANIVVKESDLSSNKTAYKLDKCVQCSVCGTSAWTVFSPKKYCKFCYRCVCKPCSGQTLFHPERNTEERCCSNCYRRFLSQYVIDDANSLKTANIAEMKEAEADLKTATETRNITQSTLVNLREIIGKLTQKLMFEQKEEDIRQENTAKTINNLKSDIGIAKKDVLEHENAYFIVEKQLKTSESALSTEKSAVVFYSEKLSKAKSDLTAAQNEFDRLRRMLDERKIGLPPESTDTKGSKTGKITELQGAIHQLREQQEALTVQNEGLKREVQRGEESDEEMKTQQGESGSMEDEHLFTLYCELREQNDHLKREKEQLAASEYRERELLKLTRDLDKLQTDNDELRTLITKQQSSPRGKKKPRLVASPKP